MDVDESDCEARMLRDLSTQIEISKNLDSNKERDYIRLVEALARLTQDPYFVLRFTTNRVIYLLLVTSNIQIVNRLF